MEIKVKDLRVSYGKTEVLKGVDLTIRPGEKVFIGGANGSGKTTLLRALSGIIPYAGNVLIDGKDVSSVKRKEVAKLIALMPQTSDIYFPYTVNETVLLGTYASAGNSFFGTDAKAVQFANKCMEDCDVLDLKDRHLDELSGGQLQRVLLARTFAQGSPFLFLDEPASGLDPGTERNLMQSLREMANGGKTVILVTHSTLQLKLCDKIVFMGKGGNLCYFGSYDDALAFFGVSDVVDVYNMITDNAPEWRNKYDRTAEPAAAERAPSSNTPAGKSKRRFQLPVLCARYIKLVANDRQRLLLLLVQAPVLALLISLVADGQQFEQYEMTKSLLFALSCSAFWVGMLNAIQEVCKERSILKREYMAGLSLNAYLLSKILVLGILCLIQSVLIIGVFAVSVGLPEEGLFMAPIVELLITTFLTAIASAAMGLFVSSLFTNADRAMTVAPILLMPQILFSGLIFKLDGATEMISWLAVCRWSMEGYGTTANLNELQLKMQQEGVMIEHEAEEFFEFTTAHMLKDWAILFAFVIIFLLLARIVLTTVGKEKG